VDDWLRAARERADVQLEHGLRALGAHRYLCDDDAERACAEWLSVAERAPEHPIFRSAMWGTLIGLYAGRLDIVERAVTLAARLYFRWSAHVVLERVLYVWARGALAAARLASGDTRLRTRLSLWLCIQRLRLEGSRLSAPLLQHLLAVRAFRRGRSGRGLVHLQRALLGFREREMPLFAAAVSHALARLHPDAGQRRKQLSTARALFQSEGLVSAERWERALVPGLPLGSPEPQPVEAASRGAAQQLA
jgi:hypothetical protein